MKKKRLRKFQLLTALTAIGVGIFGMSVQASTDVLIDENNFPDPCFREYVSGHFDVDKNGILNSDENDQAISIDFNPEEGEKPVSDHSMIGDLKGTELFENLQELNCKGCKLTTLDVSKNKKLDSLICSDNQLINLTLGENENLYSVDCSNNALKELNLSKTPLLTILYCQNNEIKCLDVTKCKGLINACVGGFLELDDLGPHYTSANLGGELRTDWGVELVTGEENFPKIDKETFPDNCIRRYVADNIDRNGDGLLSNDEINSVTEIILPTKLYAEEEEYISLKGIELFPELETLDCWCSTFTEVDLSHNPKLVKLSLGVGKIETLDLSHNPKLRYLKADQSNIKSIDLSHNPELEELYLDYNQLTELDLSKNPKLRKLGCSENKLEKLEVNNLTELQYLNCRENLLTELNLSNNPNLIYLACNDLPLKQLNISSCPNLIKLMKEGKNISENERCVTMVFSEYDETKTFCFPPDIKIFADDKELEYVVNYKFIDVDYYSWMYFPVKKVRTNGWMVGTSKNTFSPNADMTRAQFAKVLYNIAGQPDLEFNDRFDDIQDGEWYSKAVIWAASNGITQGVSKHNFGKDLPISREQLLTLLYNYIKDNEKYYFGYENLNTPDMFCDFEQTSEWAIEAMDWAIRNCIISGKSDEINEKLYADPKGIANRAECAKILDNLSQFAIRPDSSMDDEKEEGVG